MGVPKSLVSLSSKAAALVLLLLAVVVAVQAQTATAQRCTNDLTNLNVCAPFVVPGASQSNPGSDCCNALQSVQPDCLCSTLRIASRLPTQCSLPPLSCGS